MEYYTIGIVFLLSMTLYADTSLAEDSSSTTASTTITIPTENTADKTLATTETATIATAASEKTTDKTLATTETATSTTLTEATADKSSTTSTTTNTETSSTSKAETATSTTSTEATVSSTSTTNATETSTIATKPVVESTTTKSTPTITHDIRTSTAQLSSTTISLLSTTAKSVGCSERVIEQNSSNLTSCNASSSSGNVTIVFSATTVGKASSANGTCTTCEGENIPVGVSSCALTDEGKAEWIDELTWSDCTTPFESKTLKQQVESIVVATSDPAYVTAELVDETVQVLEAVSNESKVTQDTADDVLTSVNNLMVAENDGAQVAVEESWNRILNSVDETADKVELTNGTTRDAGYSSYTEVQSNLALGVVDPATEKAVFFGSDQTSIGGSLNLAAISPRLRDSAPKGIYMKATGKNRMSFKMYLTTDAIFGGSGNNLKITEVALSVSADGNFELNFESGRKFEITDGSNGRFNDTFGLECSRWNRTTSEWINGGCTSVANNANNVSCECNKGGEYTLREVEIGAIDNNSLSSGAIAGIVVGSVVGVALICGLCYYCCVTKKNKKSNKVNDEDAASKMELEQASTTKSKTPTDGGRSDSDDNN